MSPAVVILSDDAQRNPGANKTGRRSHSTAEVTFYNADGFDFLDGLHVTQYIALAGRRITVAVTGGIAAYKACDVVRLLRKAGADVSVVMTKAATAFVTPLTFETLSGHPVGVDVLQTPLSHLKASQATDLFLVEIGRAHV